MSTRARDVVKSLADAVAGVDPNKTYLEGQELGAKIGESRGRTEEAMANARLHRDQAELEEAKKASAERIRASTMLNDPNQAPIADIVTGGFGADYAGAQQGRLHAQEFGEHATVNQPAPIGDVVGDAQRQAALESLAPGSALASRGGRGAPVIAQDQGGNPIYVTPQQATSDKMKPAARPSSAGTAPTSQQKNVDFLIAQGVPRERANELIFPDKGVDTPRALYDGVVKSMMRDPLLSKPDKADAAARAVVKLKFGADAANAIGTSAPYIPQPEPADAEPLPPGIPKGSRHISNLKDGSPVYLTPDGRKMTP